MSYFKSDNAVRGIFGEKAYRKLVKLLDPCCGDFCQQVNACIEGGCLTYRAVITQNGTEAPQVALVTSNTLGITINFERNDVGEYYGIIEPELAYFESATSDVTITNYAICGEGAVLTAQVVPIFFFVFQITTFINGVPSDGVLNSCAPFVLEIRSCPPFNPIP